MCGGIAGLECEGEGEKCMLDPRGGCDPWMGGFDCAGVCVVKPEEGGVCDTRGGVLCGRGRRARMIGMRSVVGRRIVRGFVWYCR